METATKVAESWGVTAPSTIGVFGISLLLAWVLSLTSASVFCNLLFALPAILLAQRCLNGGSLTSLLLQDGSAEVGRARRRRGRDPTSESAQGSSPAGEGLFSPAPRIAPAERWREHVQSPVVEHAWETLCGSIVQEFIYDTWYTYLTPDREFPAEIRRMLNHAFGQLAVRSRRIDLRAVLRDVSELLMEQVELYRDTREAVLQDRASAAASDFLHGGLVARERSLRARLAAEGNLHPALLNAEGDYKMLRAVSDGLVGCLLDPGDSGRVATRSVARELLAGCVLRPLMMWTTPYFANKAVCRLMQEQERRRPAPEALAALDAAKALRLRGHWEFEQRIVMNAEAEAVERSVSRATSTAAMPPPPPRVAKHARTRSHDTFLDRLAPAAAADPALCPARYWSQTAGGVPRGSHGMEGSLPGALPGISFAGVQLSEGSAASLASSESATSPVREVLRQDTAFVERDSTHRDASWTMQQQPRQLPLESAAATSQVAASVLLPSPFDVGSFTAPGVAPAGLAADLQGGGAPSSPTISAEGAVCIPQAAVQAQQACYDDGHSHMSGSPDFDVLPDWQHTLDQPLMRPAATSPSVRSSLDGHFVVSGVAAAAATAQFQPAPSPPRLRASSGFVGQPCAKVAAADLHTLGTKDFVVYKIRVGDDSGREWTVSRRYRHFEVLHRQLRSLPGYRHKLPPKRIFIHTQNVDFVEERREALDLYLQAVLASPSLAVNADVWEFLRGGSERFELPPGTDGLKRGLSRQVLAATQSLGRGVVGVGVGVVDATQRAVKDTVVGVERGIADVTSAAVGGVGAMLKEAKSGFGHRSKPGSVASGLDEYEFEESSLRAGGAAGVRQRRPDALTRAGTGLLRGATASARKVRKALTTDGLPRGLTGDSDSEGYGPAGAVPASSASLSGGSASLGTSPSKRSRMPHMLPKPTKSRHPSPAKAPSNRATEALLVQRSAAFAPNALRLRVEVPGEQGYYGGGSAASVGSDREAPSLPSTPPRGGQSPGLAALYPREGYSLDPVDCAGISAPLYDIVDCIFQLQTRGFFRRQVYGVARQVLSLFAGDAIDLFLVSKLRLVRQEHTLGRAIQLIQSSLWPGGTWFMHSPQYEAAHPGAAGARAACDTGSPSLHARDAAGGPMQPENYLQPSGPPPLDEDEVREAVGELLLRNAPVALLRLVGRGAFSEGVQDVYEMMQSAAFVRQLGYGLLEIGALHLCPELKPLFNSLEHSAM